jgi:hypothetical protein
MPSGEWLNAAVVSPRYQRANYQLVLCRGIDSQYLPVSIPYVSYESPKIL